MAILSVETRLQGFNTPGSMGVVTDVTFVNCYWPKLDRPMKLFADGSSGIKVMGRLARNVIFPDDTEFLSYYPDALYPAEQAVLKAFPFRRGLMNLAPQEAQVWMDAYEAAVATFPPTHTVLTTGSNVNFLRHKEEASRRTVVLKQDATLPDGTILLAGAELVKIEYEEFVSTLTPRETLDLVDGKVTETELRASRTFVHNSEVDRDAEGRKSPVTLEAWKARR